jgi:nucleotide-binding universal stress UspA family protein
MSFSNILIPVDGSEYSEKAADKGMAFAMECSATVTFLNVVDITSLVSNSASGGEADTEIIKIFNEKANEIIEGVCRRYNYPNASGIVVEGVPREVILSMAKSKKADLIIMGTHGRTGLNHLLMGSVAEYVIRHSGIPVMVVPNPEGQ